MWSQLYTLSLGNGPLLSFQRLLDSNLQLVRDTMLDEFDSVDDIIVMQYDDDDYDFSIAARSHRTAAFTAAVIDKLLPAGGRTQAMRLQTSNLQLLCGNGTGHSFLLRNVHRTHRKKEQPFIFAVDHLRRTP